MQGLGRSLTFLWRFFTVELSTVVLHLTVVCFVCFVTAASDQPPGETAPDKIEIEIGGSANITCKIFEGGNSSRIWFSEENSKNRILQPNTEILIPDAQTAVLTIRNAFEHIGRYQCMSGRNAIGITRVYVGTPPIDVTDFSCRGYDYEYMTCSFTRPDNKIYTSYKLYYNTDSDNQNYIYNCELQTTTRLLTYCNITDHAVCNITDQNATFTYCNITDHTSPVYLPSRQIYYFKLTGTNALDSHSQTFAIINSRSVIPAKLKVDIKDITSDSITLFWKISKFTHYEEEGLEYKIRLQPKEFDWYTFTDYKQCYNANCSVTINNLKYPYRKYMLSIRVKVRTAQDKDAMWSEEFTSMFRTKPRRPDSPPNTAVGSFYIDHTETYVRLYWQQLYEHEENGPNFFYSINQTDVNGNVIKSKYTNQTSVTFNWSRNDKFNYHIKSGNSEGQSYQSSEIEVYQPVRDEFSKQNIATVYHNRTYTLGWKVPNDYKKLNNYTVFWCLSKMESSNQCKGTIHFKYLDKYVTNFTTEPQDHTLNLAISANYVDYVTGMNWAICSADDSSDLMKLEPRVIEKSMDTIKLQWSSEHVCTSILSGYNLTYCQVLLPSNISSIVPSTKLEVADCLNRKSTIVERGFKNYTIKGLKAYSIYRIEMFMYSETKVGPKSNPIYENTSEAAPSAPRNLQVNISSLTSNSVIISWLPPIETNGQLKYYTIWKNKTQTRQHNDNQKVAISEIITEYETTPHKRISFKLESLHSYSEYEVYITAHTVKDSIPSNTISFKTLIGVPTNPRNVSIAEEGNYGVLSWVEPEMPSGRVDFYVVAMVTEHKNKDNGHGGTTYIPEQMSIVVHGNKCKFRFVECMDPNFSYYLSVRAVNVAAKKEIDHITFPDTDSTASSNSIQAKNMDNVDSDIALAINTEFECLNLDPIDEKFILYSRYNDVIGGGSDELKFFPSQWENSANIYKCSHFPWAFIMKIVSFGVIITVALFSTSSWLHKRYKQMKNINAVLPEELIDHMPNYHGFSNVEKDPSDVSRSNDCLVNYQKESRQLLSAKLSNGSVVGINSLTQNSILEIDELQKKKPAPMNFSNEEHTSQSTDSVDMNDIFASSNNSTPTKDNNVIVACLSSSNEVKYPLQENIGSTSGYIKPETVILSTSTPSLANGAFVSNVPIPSANGYVLWPPQQPPTLNGYTTLDAMGKPVSSTSYSTVVSPTQQTAAKTAEIFTETTNGRVQANSKNQETENIPNGSPPPLGNHHNHNNNNNLICGYVTQRQLADFGQLMH